MPRGKPKKTGKKTAKSPRSGAEIPTGAHPKNTGGKKGRSGRKSNEFKDWAREAVADAEARQVLLSVMQNPEHRHFAAVWKMLAEYAEGKPHQSVDVTSGGRPLLLAGAI